MQSILVDNKNLNLIVLKLVFTNLKQYLICNVISLALANSKETIQK